MTAARKLDAHTATLLTATVEIKTLTVSGRQVTQAVFKQLQEDDLLDESGCEFRGVPWGRVNYHSVAKECADLGEHHHVVWQAGDELRRATVEKPYYRYQPPVPAELAEQYLDESFVFNPSWRPKDLTADYMTVDLCVPGAPEASVLGLSKQARDLLVAERRVASAERELERMARYENRAGWEATVNAYRTDAADTAAHRSAMLQVLQDKVTTLLGHSPTMDDLERAEDRMRDAMRKEFRLRERVSQTYREVCDLPQLFIAV